MANSRSLEAGEYPTLELPTANLKPASCDNYEVVCHDGEEALASFAVEAEPVDVMSACGHPLR